MATSTRLIALLAILSAATVPASAASYYFRTKPQVTPPAAPAPAKDTTPDAVTFPAVSGVSPSSQQVSAIRRLTGHEGVSVSVSGGDAQVRVCAASVADAAVGSYVQMRMTAAGSGLGRTATLSYGTLTADWTVSSKVQAVYSIATMGLSDPNIRTALETTLGTAEEWTKCINRTTAGDEQCAGAGEVLVVYRGTTTGTGKEFGVWSKGDPMVINQCFDTPRKGFYFSNANTAKGYVFDKTGVATVTGDVEICSAHIAPIYNIYTSSPLGFGSNGLWKTGWTITGSVSGQATSGTPEWYKRAAR
jgi:hypothetical protein